MKFIQIIFMSIIAVFSFNSCENRNIEVQTSFPFEAQVFGNTKALLSNTLETTILLNPERKIAETEYFFQYKSDKGVYELRGAEIPSETEVKLTSLEEQLIYKPKESGIHNVNFNFRDSNNNTTQSSIKYEITEGNIIEFNLSSSTKEINVGEKAIITAEINVEENTIVPQELSFDLLYENTDYNAFIVNNKKVYLSGEIIPNINPSKLNFEYTPGTSDVGFVKFTLKASNGKEFVNELAIKVNKTDFDFDFTPVVSKSIVGKEISINFDITQTTNEDLDFSVEISGQTGATAFSSGFFFLPHSFFNFKKGSHKFKFVPNEVNTNDFIVKVSSSNGLVKTKRITFEALPVSFDFDFNPTTIRLVNSPSLESLNGFLSIVLKRPSGLLFIEPKYSMTILSDVGSFSLQINNKFHSLGSIIDLPENTVIINNEFDCFYRFSRDFKRSGKITVILRNDTGFEIRKTVDVKTEIN